MLPSLLATKWYIPPARAGAVDRPRLIEKLRVGLEQEARFGLVSGPAGFGKTTLISAFVAQQPRPVAWLSLDEGDNDPNRFWAYLATACQAAIPGSGAPALELLRAPQPLPDEAIPTLLINAIAGQPQPLLIVLDDYHAIQNPAIHAGLIFLVDHLPPNLRLVVATRIDPPWPLARYRARNQLVEIRAQDLRFRPEEAQAFLDQTMGLRLAAGDLAALEERTEGWVAGLQLAGLALQSFSGQAAPALGAFIRAFTGSHVYVAEYLIDEVLRGQSEEMQAFLLQTAILERLSADLCAAVTGCADGQAKLKTLQQANVFLVPLDAAGEWFRYHHLFADLLRARLQAVTPKPGRQALHRRAAAWLEAQGMVAEAIDQALAAEDDDHVLRLVEAAALPMILQARVRTVEAWLEKIPAAQVENSPRINMAYAWINLLRATPLQASPYIERLRRLSADGFPPALQGEWLVIQAELRLAQGKPLESRALADQARAFLPEVDLNIRGMLSVTLAKAYQQTNEYERAAEIFEQIVQAARQSGDATFEILGISGQAQMTLKQGKLRRTFDLASEGIRRLEATGAQTPFSATLYGELGQIYFHWGQFELSRSYQRRSMEISGKSGYSDPEIYYHLMLSKMAHMQGDPQRASQEMQEAARLASAIPPAMIRENVIAQLVQVYLNEDRPAEAERLLEKEGFGFGSAWKYPTLDAGAPLAMEAGMLYNAALRVQLYHARKQYDYSDMAPAVQMGEEVLHQELERQNLPGALETLLLLAQIQSGAGQREESLALAARALALAEPERFVSAFLEEGQPAAALLAALRVRGVAGAQRGFLEEVLAAFPGSPASQATLVEPPVASLVEPLTARELEVLRLIAAGDSNQDIARKLTITVSAVKKHTGNIYGKLGVNSRTQAVLRARQLGMS